ALDVPDGTVDVVIGAGLAIRTVVDLEALDVLEEVARQLSVLALRAVVPGLDEVVGLDLGAVSELLAFLEFDR
ncbi:hypothetical protein, partial [Microbacterium aurum]